MDYSEIFISKNESIEDDIISDFLEQFIITPKIFGHQKKDPHVGCSDRIIGDFEMIYTIGGKSHITIENNNYICRSGDLILIPPFTRHTIQSDLDEPHDQYWLHFDVHPFYLHEEFKKYLFSSSDYLVTIGQNELLINLYCLLERELEHYKPGYRIFFQTILLQILIIIFRKEFNPDNYNNTTAKKTSKQVLLDKCMDYIYDNISEQIYIDDLCRFVNVSQSHLFKIFNNYVKFPPAKFIQFIKVKKGEQLLKTTPLTIKEISIRLGFNSPFYFTKVFKEYYQVSPRQYKKQMNY